MPTRRHFLATLGGAAVGAAAIGCARTVPAEKTTKPLAKVGIQLYTVRSLMSKDVEGTLARVASIGYREVEFAGYFGRTPAQIRDTLSANRLVSPSTHIDFPATDDEWMRTLDATKSCGHEWAVIPDVDARMRKAPDGWARIAERFNKLGAKAQSVGLKFAFHNHDTELVRIGSGTALDTLIANTDPTLVDFEMDLYWVVKGGGDPLDFITRYPHRFPLMHVKDATAAPARAMADVGSGTIDFAKIFARENTSGMLHAFVEHDSPADPIISATNSYRYLAALRY